MISYLTQDSVSRTFSFSLHILTSSPMHVVSYSSQIDSYSLHMLWTSTHSRSLEKWDKMGSVWNKTLHHSTPPSSTQQTHQHTGQNKKNTLSKPPDTLAPPIDIQLVPRTPRIEESGHRCKWSYQCIRLNYRAGFPFLKSANYKK